MEQEKQGGSKKGCVIGGVCLGVILLGVGALGACIWGAILVTAPVADASDLFLSKIAEGNIGDAYKESASTLRASTSEQEFTASVKALGLDGYQSASWTSRNIVNQDGTVQGTVTTQDGGEIQLAISLLHEGGVWRVASFGPSAALPNGMPKPPTLEGGPSVPSDAEMQKLVTASVVELGTALGNNDWDTYHAGLATAFQREHTAEAIGGILSKLTAEKDAISSVGGLEPIYDAPPSLDGAGDLKADGSFAVESKRVRFSLWYRFEEDQWKLLSINVIVKAKPEKLEPLPSAEALQQLVKATLLAFNEGVQSSSFASFHSEHCSPQFQTEVSLERFTTVFKQFVDQKIDIGAISEVEAAFSPAAVVNEEDGILVLEGSYPTKPSQVQFNLQFEWVVDAWKVLSINVTVK